MEQLQHDLSLIRQYHFDQYQHDLFNQWVNCYDEHLCHLYDIYSSYFSISYDDFLKLAYQCTAPYYDYKTKRYKRLLL
ncbi:MAG TPA: hypothetical protein VLG50_08185 [Candidatus Saccharimonadales bacterium]|nr:hypothetical protein [Candidatus Saccharimonadales bacterium]